MEDYSRARVLAHMEHGGFKFRVVKRRIGGKAIKSQFALLHGLVPVSYTPADYGLVPALTNWAEAFSKIYPRGMEADLETKLAQYAAEGGCG